MRSLLIVGAGGHGKVVADTALMLKRWERIGFADDIAEAGSAILGLKCVGKLSSFEQLRDQFDCVAIGIGDNSLRYSVFLRAREAGFQLPIIVHPSASISPFASLKPGCVVFAQAAINVGAELGEACVVNTGATVDHDCRLAAAVHLSPGAHLAGNVVICSKAWIGIGACIRQGLTVGEGAIVGAGSVVVKNVRSGTTVYGVPAEVRA